MAGAYMDPDLNGDIFVGTAEGEQLDSPMKYHVYFQHGMPAANNVGDHVDFTAAQSADFIHDQVVIILATNPGVTPLAAYLLGFFRLLQASRGLISPLFDPAVHHVKYNDAVRGVAGSDVEAYIVAGGSALRTVGAGAGAVTWDLANAAAGVPREFTAEKKKTIRLLVTDLLCLVAFFMRARGHHFLDDLADRYAHIWEKTRNDAAIIQDMGNWQYIATTGCHAIYPHVLDEFYLDAVRRNVVNGALKKRVDVPAAGTAIYRAVLSGWQDLQMVFNKVEERIPASVEYIRQLQTVFNSPNGRWVGSVNRQYYGVTDTFAIREDLLAPLAATIMGAYEALVTGGTLQQSPALKRVANGAPLIKAILGKAATRASNDERFNLLD